MEHITIQLNLTALAESVTKTKYNWFTLHICKG